MRPVPTIGATARPWVAEMPRMAGPERLADGVYKHLADEIVLGRLAPGMRLEEMMLASHYRVSRTPIREALKRLADLGLVDCRPNQGSVVATIPSTRLDHMFEAIGELEAACARYAALRMTEPQRGRLEELHGQCRAAMQAHDMTRYDLHNRALHTLILEGSHNSVLIEAAEGLWERAVPYRRTQFRQIERAARSYEEHCGVVEAILAHDAVGASREMRAHVAAAHRAATRLAWVAVGAQPANDPT